MNDILKQDIEEILNKDIPFKEFANKTILITGATGLIGSLIVKTLVYCNCKMNLNMHIIGLVRNMQKVERIFEEVECREVCFVDIDLNNEKINIDGAIDFIIHTAAITNSKQMVLNPTEVIHTSVYGTEKILKLALEKKAVMVYVSSMEIYGNPNLSRMVTEEDYGYIDLANVRSCYPEAKRMSECLCTAYFVQYGVKVCIARLAQTFGAGIHKEENRVFAQFAKSVIAGENIVLHTTGESEGNYVYTSDAIYALLLLLVRGEYGQAYNVANEESHMTIVEMAKMVCTCFDKSHSTNVVFDIPTDAMKYGYAPPTKMHLSSEKLIKIGWHAQIGLEEAYRRTIEYMKEM